MARKLRYIPQECLVEVTVRTVQGRFLLRPSAKLRDRIVGILARAQEATGMKVCAFVYLSNHTHMLLRPLDAQQLARFMAYVNSNVAREAGRLHHWKERFWGRRYADAVVSDETEAQEERLRYLLAQGVKEGLVASPRHWPGASSTSALLTGESPSGEWINRSEQYRAHRRGEPNPSRRFASRHLLELVTIPCWDELSCDEVRVRVRKFVQAIEREFEDNARRPLGRRAILEQDPHARPAHFSRSQAPRFHAVEPELRRALEWAYRLFRIEYRQISRDFRRGLSVEFPPGCFRPATFAPQAARPG